jgi:hypothetical protein
VPPAPEASAQGLKPQEPREQGSSWSKSVPIRTAFEGTAHIRLRPRNKFKRKLEGETIWRSLRYRAATFIIVACLGLVVAAHVGRDRRGGESTDASAMEETTGSIGGSARATTELALSDEERGLIYEGLMRISDESVAHVPAPVVADALPSEVPLHDLPAGMAKEIPLVQGHKYVRFDDRIVVVDPASRVVVAMIPRYKLLP